MTIDKKSTLHIALILSVSCALVTSIAVGVLYERHMEDMRRNLVVAAQSQAKLIEAVARYDLTQSVQNPNNYLSNRVEQTLQQVKSAHESYSGFGETGEFNVAQLRSDSILFLLQRRHDDTLSMQKSIPMNSIYAEPMRRALLGQSGVVKGLDYRGELVLAAYEPVTILNMGIVAKIDMKEVRAPFYTAILFAASLLIIIVLLGVFLVIRATKPLASRFRKQAEEIEHSRNVVLQVLESIPFRVFWKDIDSNFMGCNTLFARDAGCDRPEELEGKSDYEMSWADQADLYRADDQEVIQSKQPKLQIVEQQTSPTGETIWLRTDKVPLRSSTGEVWGILGLYEDITERKQVEQDLSDSKALMEAVIENVPLMVFLKEAKDLRFVMFNRAGVDLLGYESKDLLGKNNLDLFPPEQAAHFMAKDREVLDGESGMLDIPEEPILTAKKGQRLLHTRKVCIRGADGTTKYLLGISEDITERKQATSELEQANAILTAIYENTPTLIFAKDRDGRFVVASHAVETALGTEKKQIIGHLDTNFHLPEIAAKIIANDQEVICSGVAQCFEETINTPNGPRIFLSTKSPWFNEQRNIIGTIGIAVDRTEHILAMAELERVNAILTAVYENTTSLIFAKDRDSRIVAASPTVAKLLGMEQEQIVGHNDFDYLPHEIAANIIANDQEVIVSGNAQTFEETVDTSGGPRNFITTKSPWRNSRKDIIGIIGVALDITEHVQAEGKRMELERQLRQSQKLETIGTLAGGIAHDFNNILVPILIYSEELIAQNKENKTICDDLQEIKTAAHRARDLVNHILTFSRQSESNPSNINIRLVIEEAVKLCRASFPSTIAVDLQCDCQDSRVLADPTQIYQVVMNLCINASHAIGDSRGRVLIKLERLQLNEETAVQYPTLQVGKYVVLSVEDSGAGIDAAILEHIFDPFFTTKEVGKGTGLGLSIVHGIVKSHMGDILVKTHIGSGSTFSVYLPETAASEDACILEKPKVRAGTEHVLLVDDEPMIARTGTKVLERFGYRVTATTSASMAIKSFEAQPQEFDIVITDQTMPQMSGDQLLKALRAIRPDIPIIVMTGFSAKVTADNFASLGFDGYVQKPMIPVQFHTAIRCVLDQNTVTHL